VLNVISLSGPSALAAYVECFDGDWYLGEYKEVQTLIADGRVRDAADHYATIGYALLYNPNPYFDTAYYSSNSDYLNTHLSSRNDSGHERTALWHYLTSGILQGIEPTPWFNSRFYMSKNKDVSRGYSRLAFTCPYAHWVKYGVNENRKPSAQFDPTSYERSVPRAGQLVREGVARNIFHAKLLIESGRESGA
jgi:hypothetical protein